MANINYKKYKILIDPESKKTPGFKVGDVVRRQYQDDTRLVYSLMVVMETGVDVLTAGNSHYFIGALIEGDEPVAGELLDFVRVTSLKENERSGALYLTASDSEAPYMDVIDNTPGEKALFYPVSADGVVGVADERNYTVDHPEPIRTSFTDENVIGSRVLRMKRVSDEFSEAHLGIHQTLTNFPSYPERVIIAFRTKSTVDADNIPVVVGCDRGNELDTSLQLTIKDKFHLFIFSVDYPAEIERFFKINFLNALTTKNSTVDIAEMCMIRLSDISSYADGTKVRIGKVQGVVDPVFGKLQGYGAYFQNLYATKNVNIAGTLTAGDEKGFSSTFYVGKIHKNIIPNSIDCDFYHGIRELCPDPVPAGIGNAWHINGTVILTAQTGSWRESHVGELYCFSVWIKSKTDAKIVASVDNTTLTNFDVPGDNIWHRYHHSFRILSHSNANMQFLLGKYGVEIDFCSPQIEAGTTPTQYQPTDGKLSYVEDYGAWFAKGGIGGTIQNPLLKLNEDGSISSRDGSFVINPDGTGYFSGGKFSWDKENITLKDIVIRWEDLDEQAKENLKGEPGADGKDGKDGKNGIGIDGKDGKDGDKGEKGDTGRDGVDANLLDWVKDWDSGKTVISSDTVITPKIFAGNRNSNGTITGTAIGKFSLLSRNSSGQFQSEDINGIYGFYDGLRTFAVDNTGSVEIGRAEQSIRYDSVTGKVVFGEGVSLHWIDAIEHSISGIQVGVRNYIKYSTFVQDDIVDIISVDNVNCTIDTSTKYQGYNSLKITQTVPISTTGSDGRVFFKSTKICNPASFSMWVKANESTTLFIRMGSNRQPVRFDLTPDWRLIKLEDWTPNTINIVFGVNTVGTIFNIALPMLVEGTKAVDWNPSPDDLRYDVSLAKAVADGIVKQAGDEGWSTKMTYIDKNGIFTGTLSSNTVNAIAINASQITAGTISVNRLDVNSLKSQLITAANIEALTLNVTKGKIGGWSLDSDSIFRGTKLNTAGSFTAASGSITIGSNGIRGFKWNLDSTGAGKVAAGNIAWDAAGNVTFGASVSVNWTNAANTALQSAKDYTDSVGSEVREAALAMSFGKILYRDPTFVKSINGIGTYNNSSNGTVTITRIIDQTAPNDSKYILNIKTAGVSSPGLGGFTFSTISAANKILIARIIAKIPIGYTLTFASNGTGTPTTRKFLTDNKGTGEWVEYVHKLICGPTGTFSSTNFFHLKGTSATEAKPVEWQVCFATVYDVTSIENLVTTIDANGIYTGTLIANQVNAVDINASSIKTGTLSADRIAAGSIKADKLDAASVRASIINADYVSGLSLNFKTGTIGGWQISATGISSSSGNILISNSARCISIWGSGSSHSSGSRVGLYYSSDTNYGFWASDASGTAIVRFGDTNRIAGWVITSNAITKNSVSLGADGTIANGTKWRLANDGSGSIASGNISWDTTGKVTFGSSVSLQWKNDIESAKSENYGYAFYKKIVIYGESDKYYPVIIKGGDQSVLRDILVKRKHGEQAPNDWYTSTHKGGLTLLIRANFGGWGGAKYTWNIYELAEVYSNMFAGAGNVAYNTMFYIFLRGGGSTGAVYHIYSDQQLDNLLYSTVGEVSQDAPQICYNSDLIMVSGDYRVYAPAPRTLTAAVEEEIRKKRFIQLSESTDTYLGQHPLTYIGSTGIYTGTLTAAQVNAVNIDASSIKTGNLSVDRLVAGSIKADKLDLNSVRASIVTADHINGLSLNVVKGRIGGWTIGADNITNGTYAVGQTPIQIRSASIGSGYVYNGAFKPYGITLSWYQSSNAGSLILGQVLASGNSVKTGFMGLQLMSWDSQEYFCLAANTTKSGSKEIYNRIAGWAFDHQNISKNNVKLGADGSITNGNLWKFNNDGSGQIAGGNIQWNATGAVTFSSAVSLSWVTGINNASDLARAMTMGTMMYRAPEFFMNGAIHWNNTSSYLANGTRSLVQVTDCPNSTGYSMRITVTDWNNSTDLRASGFYFVNCKSRANAIFVVRIIAIIPVGRNINNYHNAYGGGNQKWLTSQAGTGDWEEYLCQVNCGPSGTFSTINHFALTGGTAPTAANPLVWEVGYATVIDITAAEKLNTTIDINGIYTGSIKANQITVNSSIVVGGATTEATYNGSIIIRNTSNINVVVLDRTGIAATAGKIGGWTIDRDSIYRGTKSNSSTTFTSASGSVTIGSNGIRGYRWNLDANGAGRLAAGNISWTTAGALTVTGTINATAGQIGGFTVASGRIGSTASGTSSTGGELAIYKDLIRVGTTTSYTLLGGNTFSATLGGHMSTARFTNNRSSSYLHNYGVYCDVKYGYRNYGVWSNAACVAPAFCNIGHTYTGFTGSGYLWDFSQSNIFYVWASAYYSITLPNESSVAYMFGYSTLPSSFAYVFTIIYEYNWSNKIRVDNVINNNGAKVNVDLAKGDVLTLLCTKRLGFHYQILNHHY